MSNKSKKFNMEGEETTVELFRTLDQNTKTLTRSKLLECLQQEHINHVRDKIGDAVAEIARQDTDLGMLRRCERPRPIRDSDAISVLQAKLGTNSWWRSTISHDPASPANDQLLSGFLRPRPRLSKNSMNQQSWACSSRDSKIPTFRYA